MERREFLVLGSALAAGAALTGSSAARAATEGNNPKGPFLDLPKPQDGTSERGMGPFPREAASAGT